MHDCFLASSAVNIRESVSEFSGSLNDLLRWPAIEQRPGFYVGHPYQCRRRQFLKNQEDVYLGSSRRACNYAYDGRQSGHNAILGKPS